MSLLLHTFLHFLILESGIFRADLQYKFKLNPTMLDTLMNTLDDTLEFAIVKENEMSMDDMVCMFVYICIYIFTSY